MKYWLLKSEPDVFSISDLQKKPKQTDHWDGVRNYQARNFLRDEMKNGDQAFFYHSNCKQPGITGIVTIVKGGHPDSSAFDNNSPYYDPKSDPNNPRWYQVDVKFSRLLPRTITLEEIKQHPDLQEMLLVRRGNRLSVLPITAEQWKCILDIK